MNTIIRKAEQRDIAEIMTLWRGQSDFHYALDPVYYTPTTRKGDEQFETYIRKALTTGNPQVRVAEFDGKVIGFVTFAKEVDDYPDTYVTAFGYILELFVTAAYRKHGIGKQLMDEAEAFFKKEGLQFVKVVSSAFNTNAIRFYQDNGYVSRQIALYKKIV